MAESTVSVDSVAIVISYAIPPPPTERAVRPTLGAVARLGDGTVARRRDRPRAERHRAALLSASPGRGMVEPRNDRPTRW
jgi:hypothetical protein